MPRNADARLLEKPSFVLLVRMRHDAEREEPVEPAGTASG